MALLQCNSCGSDEHAGKVCPITGVPNGEEWERATQFDGILVNGNPVSIYELNHYQEER